MSKQVLYSSVMAEHTTERPNVKESKQELVHKSRRVPPTARPILRVDVILDLIKKRRCNKLS